jgi:hypothetical protein
MSEYDTISPGAMGPLPWPIDALVWIVTGIICAFLVVFVGPVWGADQLWRKVTGKPPRHEPAGFRTCTKEELGWMYEPGSEVAVCSCGWESNHSYTMGPWTLPYRRYIEQDLRHHIAWSWW